MLALLSIDVARIKRAAVSDAAGRASRRSLSAVFIVLQIAA